MRHGERFKRISRLISAAPAVAATSAFFHHAA
jgi:hypothetical protein